MNKIKNVFIETELTTTEAIEVAKKLKILGLKEVKNIEKADMFLGNIGAKDLNNFEPSVSSVVGAAKAHAMGIPVVLYGYDTAQADKRGEELGLVKNQIGLSILKDASKTIGNKTEVLGDFLYENIHGNGMLVFNTSLINIYDQSTTDALEILAAVFSVNSGQEVIFDKFKTVKEMDQHMAKFYNESNIYTPPTIESFKPVNSKRIKKQVENKSYMIGDDVFFISQDGQELVKERLLRERVNSMASKGISAIVPCEMGESTKYNLGVVIEGNNAYAKHSKSFAANLHTMPLEISAVDAGSLYEIALNLAMGGCGVISVDENYKSVNGLDTFFKTNKDRLKIIVNASNEEMSKGLKTLIQKVSKMSKSDRVKL